MEALKAIMAIDGRAVVVMLSSLGTEEAVTGCLEAGAKTFLQKPLEKDTLIACLRDVLK